MTQESENVLVISAFVIGPNSDQHMWLTVDMVNDTICIPAWWHDSVRGVRQQFNSVKSVRLALIYYAIAKKFVYKFVKNNKKRITVECLKKQDTGYAWRFHTLMITHNTIFATKTFNPVHTYSGDMGTDGHRRASRKFVASILQNILKYRPTYRVCDVRKDYKA